jgi:NTE family protein
MKIGLALSGGGARGFAHLGVIKALEEMGLRISEVSGTSAGAISGAFYCYGYSPDAIFNIISATGFIKSVRPAWSWAGLLSMEGFREMLLKHLPDNSFESLKIPLTISATEIRLGKVVYFNEGVLVPRIVASSSIPALFDPVLLDGHVFVDGGIMDNLPVRPLVGKSDFIIGSHCNPVEQRFDLRNVKEVTERSLLIAINVNASHSKTHCNVVIEPPNLGRYSTFELAKAREIFDLGYIHTKQMYPEIEQKIKQYTSANNVI